MGFFNFLKGLFGGGSSPSSESSSSSAPQNRYSRPSPVVSRRLNEGEMGTGKVVFVNQHIVLITYGSFDEYKAIMRSKFEFGSKNPDFTGVYYDGQIVSFIKVDNDHKEPSTDFASARLYQTQLKREEAQNFQKGDEIHVVINELKSGSARFVYKNISGMIPASELSLEPVNHAKEVLRIHQSVKVSIFYVDIPKDTRKEPFIKASYVQSKYSEEDVIVEALFEASSIELQANLIFPRRYDRISEFVLRCFAQKMSLQDITQITQMREEDLDKHLHILKHFKMVNGSNIQNIRLTDLGQRTVEAMEIISDIRAERHKLLILSGAPPAHTFQSMTLSSKLIPKEGIGDRGVLDKIRLFQNEDLESLLHNQDVIDSAGVELFQKAINNKLIRVSICEVSGNKRASVPLKVPANFFLLPLHWNFKSKDKRYFRPLPSENRLQSRSLNFYICHFVKLEKSIDSSSKNEIKTRLVFDCTTKSWWSYSKESVYLEQDPKVIPNKEVEKYLKYIREDVGHLVRIEKGSFQRKRSKSN